jgi:hypothetical protein
MPRQGEGGTLIGATLLYKDFQFSQGVQYNCNCAVQTKGILALPFLTGKSFLPQRTQHLRRTAFVAVQVRSRRKKACRIAPGFPFVYVVSFVFELFPAEYGRAGIF